MDIFDSCTSIRKNLTMSGLHYFVNESPFSLWITVKKKKIDSSYSESDILLPSHNDEDLENEIVLLKKKLQESEKEIKNLKDRNMSLLCSAKHKDKQLNNTFISLQGSSFGLRKTDSETKLNEPKQDFVQHETINQKDRDTLRFQTKPSGLCQKLSSIHSMSSFTSPISNVSSDSITSLQANHITNMLPCQAKKQKMPPTFKAIHDSTVSLLTKEPFTNSLITCCSQSNPVMSSPKRKLQLIPANNLHLDYAKNFKTTSNFNIKTTDPPTFNSSASTLTNRVFQGQGGQSKPFKCEICGERFLQPSNMDLHIRRVHREPYT